MSYDPRVAVATFLYETLTSPPINGVLDVYDDAAPEGATAEGDVWIEFEDFHPGDDVWEVGAQTIWTEFAMTVRAMTRGRDLASLGDIAAEIYTRLHRVAGTVQDAEIVSATRQRPEHGSWTEMGIEYRSLGGLYNIIVQPA